MNRKLISLIVALLLVTLAGCALAESETITVTDMAGRTITLDQPASRIIALMPADCEILFALGGGDLLVGRGEYCDYPLSVVELPAVQSGANANVEEIIALEPQIVLMSAMSHTDEQVAALEDAGVNVVISDAQDIEGVYTAIRMIGALTDRGTQAEELVADMQATFDSIGETAENTGKTVYFEVSPLQYGLWTAGTNTFMDELATMCGLTNAFADVNGWAEISEEQVLERNPDYIVTITMYYGEGPTPVEEIMSRNGWADLKAVSSGNVLNADSNEISRPGPRLKDAALLLYQFIQGNEEGVEPAA